jgi:hypothetical protein
VAHFVSQDRLELLTVQEGHLATEDDNPTPPLLHGARVPAQQVRARTGDHPVRAGEEVRMNGVDARMVNLGLRAEANESQPRLFPDLGDRWAIESWRCRPVDVSELPGV